MKKKNSLIEEEDAVGRVRVVERTMPDMLLNGLSVVYIEMGVAVPDIPQHLMQTLPINDPVIEEALRSGNPVVVVTSEEDLHINPAGLKGETGVVGLIERIDDNIPGVDYPLIVFDAYQRVRIKSININSEGLPKVEVSSFPISGLRVGNKLDTALKVTGDLFEEMRRDMENSSIYPFSHVIREYDTLHAFLYMLFVADLTPKIKREIMAEKRLENMIRLFCSSLISRREEKEFRDSLQDRARREMDEDTRQAILHQEMAIIKEQLGEGSDSDENELRARAEAKKWDEQQRKHFDKELAKLLRFPVNTPDYGIQYNYLDILLSLPWNNYRESDFDFDKIERTLNEDHYGLERVKERILEQMAVAKLRADNKAPILCLVGPPGVGKTSLGKSIASAMDREYSRVSFGGMHDEAEIRGHRRTYLGAMPGRIISSMSKLESSNPVMVLDEIDKTGRDFKGDPAMALLEVLDPEQNHKFHDNYLDVDYDLSHILFIATANSLDTISAPLLDRMEVISIPGYITAEKVEIGRRHILPKALEANGFAKDEIEFSSEALEYLIDYYTRESGVRRLEKMISKVLRKLALKKVRGEGYATVVDRQMIKTLLGKEEFNPESYETNDFTGVVTGLAWTSVGGEILFVESSITEGKGKLTLTGNLGDVMKESASIALQYLKSHAHEIGLKSDSFEKHDFHIHVPEGAIPKDGPSAGITMATSLASAMTGRKVRNRIAMTGEITLRGKVLPVGGIKEKIIAAKRAGIEEIILSLENEKDILEIPGRYLEGLTFTYVRRVGEVLREALEE